MCVLSLLAFAFFFFFLGNLYERFNVMGLGFGRKLQGNKQNKKI